MERMPVTYRHRPNVTTCKFDGSLARHYADVSLPADAVGIWWLGQAGFALRYGQFSLLIDPYLSDSLARKYAGTELPHTRMMSAPISPAEFDGIDAVLTSHGHTDHMDGDTLGVLAEHYRRCRFVVPRAERELALDRGVPEGRAVFVDAGETVDLYRGGRLHVTHGAHETVKTDSAGQHHYLGFVLHFGQITVYHAGDTLPYDGLSDLLREHEVDVAMLYHATRQRPERRTSGKRHRRQHDADRGDRTVPRSRRGGPDAPPLRHVRVQYSR